MWRDAVTWFQNISATEDKKPRHPGSHRSRIHAADIPPHVSNTCTNISQAKWSLCTVLRRAPSSPNQGGQRERTPSCSYFDMRIKRAAVRAAAERQVPWHTGRRMQPYRPPWSIQTAAPACFVVLPGSSATLRKTPKQGESAPVDYIETETIGHESDKHPDSNA